MSDNIVTVTDANFETEVLQSELPVLVDYWAEWCGPCKMIGPMLEDAAGELAGRVRIGKLNIDQNPESPAKFGIRSIPTLMLFKDGAVQSQQVGAVSKSQLMAFLDGAL